MKVQIKDKNPVRLSIRIEGIVQGVGFRPFVFNLARNLFLSGYVLNNSRGVDIEIEGDKQKAWQFLQKLKNQSPPLAMIEKINYKILSPVGYTDFKIRESQKQKDKFLPISPDISICDECLQELFDPCNRRYLYPFINCTNCGPRFTIVKDVPYDRERTTMDKFKMCPDCQSEYENPSNRRFHAQPNACWRCGPRVQLIDRTGEKIATDNPIFFGAELLKKGNILAIKGIGGYHLACDATNSQVIKRLRERKNRIDKPFALMMLNLKQIKKYCRLTREEESFILSPRRPIVLLERKNEDLPREIAPKNKYLGVMLPYTPLHYLLLKEVRVPLVMTSGNISEEPIAYKDEDALSHLNKIADYFLVHNREIQIRVDDSVGRVVGGKPSLIRRSRGYAPQPLKMNFVAKRAVLATGAHLKNTFCFLKKNYAFLSHHIGDLENLAALLSLEEGIGHYERIFQCHPEVVCCDLHPNYSSTNLAREYAEKRKIPLIFVQHHHAHIVSVMAEQGINEAVIGIAFDGSGLGTDGKIWGGEFLIANYVDFERKGHLNYLPLPGGEGAIKEPWRMGLSYLNEIYGEKCPAIAEELFPRKTAEIELIQKLIKKKINTPLTSSAGRLFDAIASILGIREKINYEGQAAIELEMLSIDERKKFYPFKIIEKDGKFTVDTLPLVEAIIEEKRKGEKKENIAGRFHWSISQIIMKACSFIRKEQGLNQVILSGGVFQNNLLLKQVLSLLRSSGFKVILPELVPPNDGGIALGQAVVGYYQAEQ